VWRRYNREWHVVAESKPLAGAFKAYLLNDYEQARPLQDTGHGAGEEAAAELPDLLVPDDTAEERAARPTPARFPPLPGRRRLRSGRCSRRTTTPPWCPLIESATASVEF
jgi:hypothetical protein